MLLVHTPFANLYVLRLSGKGPDIRGHTVIAKRIGDVLCSLEICPPFIADISWI
jgi:hypothetical protein